MKFKKNEAIKYCELDCRSLYLILDKFNESIGEKFNIDFNKYSTLPGLIFNIYLSNYYKNEYKISMISSNSKIFNDINQSYTGGSVDMFIPTNQSNEFIYGYDVNSLYPSVMLNNKFSSGNPIYF